VLSSTDPGTNLPLPVTVAAKHYDWTYTVTYPGHHSDIAAEIESPPDSMIPWTDADPENPSHSIPLAELTRPDPILFYAEIPLFEDELHDNGSSNLLVRIVRLPTQ
jgi:type 2A phosphatase activator TIP41